MHKYLIIRFDGTHEEVEASSMIDAVLDERDARAIRSISCLDEY